MPNSTLKNLHHEAAGRLITAQVPLVHPDATIEEVEKMLLEKTKWLETINYIYVTEQQKKLVGVISIKEIFRSPKKTRVSEVMKTELVTARPHTYQERVALLAIKHNIKAIPVIDHEGKFLGAFRRNFKSPPQRGDRRCFTLRWCSSF